MGVEREDYIVIGANIGYDRYDDDRYEDYDVYRCIKEVGEMTYVIDGMSGKYFIVGEVVKHADDYDGFGVNELVVDEESSKRVVQFILDKFGMNVEPKIIVVTHWH